MDRDFWLTRWQANEIGFHEGKFNSLLEQFWAQTNVPSDATVLVPLCGKSQDLIWLGARGHSVIGVEFSPKAITDFFQENKVSAHAVREGAHEIWQGGNFTLYCGDFFQLEALLLTQVRGVYDRAALVALPEAQRAQYVQHLTRILPTGVTLLLITLEYAIHEMNGPPFAVLEHEVTALYGAAFHIEKVYSTEVIDRLAHLKTRGLTSMVEKAYIMRSRY